eukprot:2741685-Alexandrium_andersonii.AAC.1
MATPTRAPACAMASAGVPPGPACWAVWPGPADAVAPFACCGVFASNPAGLVPLNATVPTRPG